MSSGASGGDDQISAAKIDPLTSDMKSNIPHDQSSRGAVGTDRNIDLTRIDPLGGKGQYQHTESHADSQGSVGRDDDIAGSRIIPLDLDSKQDAQRKQPGLDDELVDKARQDPLGQVREQTV